MNLVDRYSKDFPSYTFVSLTNLNKDIKLDTYQNKDFCLEFGWLVFLLRKKNLIYLINFVKIAVLYAVHKLFIESRVC